MIKIGEVQINNNISKNMYRIIYVFSIIISCLLLYFSLKGFIMVDVLGQATKTEGFVTNNLYTPKTNSNSQTHYRVEFKYVVDSKEYTVVEDLGDKIFKYDIGEKIKIYYNNNNVGEARIYRISYIPLCFSIMLLIMTTIIIVKSEQRI